MNQHEKPIATVNSFMASEVPTASPTIGVENENSSATTSTIAPNSAMPAIFLLLRNHSMTITLCGLVFPEDGESLPSTGLPRS